MSEKSIKERLRSSSKSEKGKDSKMAASSTQGSSNINDSQSGKELQELLQTPVESISSEKIWEVLKLLVSSMNEIKMGLENVKGKSIAPSSTQSLSEDNHDRPSFEVRLNQVECLADATITRVNLIGNLMIRLEERSDALQEDVKNSKRAKKRPNLIVRGIVETTDETNESMVVKANDFFKTQMQIEETIPIKKAYRLGRKDNHDRPMMVRLCDAQDKSTIYKSVSNLKGKTNAKRKLFNIDDDMDPEQAESKNYYRDLLRENAAKEEGEKLQLKMIRGQIVANNQKVRQALLEPTSARILSMTQKGNGRGKSYKTSQK